MATIAAAPILLNNVTLQIGADNFELALSKVQLDPTTPVTEFKGFGGTVISVAGTPSWKMTVEGLQDPAAAASLSEYARTNTGAKTAILKPNKPASGTSPTYTIDVLITPVSIGGSIDSLATFSVTWNCNGQPVRTVA